MARISGVNLPNKPVAIALTYIFGIGRTSAVKICDTANVAREVRANDLGDDEYKRKIFLTQGAAQTNNSGDEFGFIVDYSPTITPSHSL